MKKTLKLLTLSTLFCGLLLTASCNKNNDNEENGNEIPTSWFNGTITAVVENGNDYNSVIKRVFAMLLYEYLDEEEWLWAEVYAVIAFGNYVNSGFTITLPNSLNDKYLFPIQRMSQMPEMVNITDSAARWTTIFVPGFVAIPSASGEWEFDGDSTIGWLHYATVNFIEWDDYPYLYSYPYVAFPVFVDRDVIITGTYENEWEWVHDGEKFIRKQSEEWSVSLKKGWNWLYWTENRTETKTATGTEIRYTGKFTTKAISGLKWHYGCLEWLREHPAAPRVPKGTKNTMSRNARFPRFGR